MRVGDWQKLAGIGDEGPPHNTAVFHPGAKDPRSLVTSTPIALGLADRVRLLFGWTVRLFVETPYETRRSDVGRDYVNFGPSEGDAFLRAPRWWPGSMHRKILPKTPTLSRRKSR